LCTPARSARLHGVVARQQQVVAAWHAGVAHRLRLRQVLASVVQRWSHLALSGAFEQWKTWALRTASLHRRMRAVMSLLAGRSLQWAFCMLRCVAGCRLGPPGCKHCAQALDSSWLRPH
jgi:hypothetical protein